MITVDITATSPASVVAISTTEGTWGVIEDALCAWIRSATGLPTILAEQTGARPSGAFATVKLGELVPVAAVDELLDETDLTRPAGSEIELKVNAVREFGVSVQVFTSDVVNDSTARRLLLKAQASLSLPSVREAIAAVGVSPYDLGRVQVITALVGTKFEGRAQLDARFYVLENVSDFTGYFDTVETHSYMGPPDLGTAEAIDI